MKHIFICTALLVAVALIGSAAAASCAGGSCGTAYTPVTTQESGCGRVPVVNVAFPNNPTGCVEMPRLPHEFGGCVIVNGKPAPEGTAVGVWGDGVAGTFLQVGPNGCFGQGTFDQKLSATGIKTDGGMINVPEGTPLKFTIWMYDQEWACRVCSGSTCLSYWPFHSGHYTPITLTANVDEPGCDGCDF
jgi:hypothetical protein